MVLRCFYRAVCDEPVLHTMAGIFRRKRLLQETEFLKDNNRQMKKELWILIGFLFSGLFSTAQTADRKTLLFDDGWKFHFGHAADPAKDFNYRIANIYSKSGKAENSAIDPTFKDEGWTPVQLPHDWVVELPFVYSPNFDVQSHGYKPVGGLYPETSIGWYRKHFVVNGADTGKHFSIRFDGIFRDAKIWINGFYLGNNESGYMGISFDITDFISFDRENVIVVRVDASQYEGWFYEGAGIYRHVWLNKFNSLHIPENGVFVHADVKESSALITAETEVENRRTSASAGP